MKIGAENRKAVIALAVLGAGALYGVYSTFLAGPSVPTARPTPAPVRDSAADGTPALIPPQTDLPGTSPARGRNSARSEEFRPVLRSKRKEDQIDPTTVDPTIKWDLLAKLQEVPAAGGGRNLFQFGAAPAPKPALKGPETQVELKPTRLIGPRLLPEPPPKPGPPPPPPPVPFNAKYYGLATSATNGNKRAFFLDGDNIIIRSEGENVIGHFKLVRIGTTSVIVEDTESKREQTVQIAEEAVQG